MVRAQETGDARGRPFDCLAIAHMERQQLNEIYSYDQGFDQVVGGRRVGS